MPHHSASLAHTVASHAGGVLHHGCATAENTVHQSGFADVRTSDHGKYADRFRTILAFATRERRSIDQLLIAFIQLIAFEVGNVLAVFLFLDASSTIRTSTSRVSPKLRSELSTVNTPSAADVKLVTFESALSRAATFSAPTPETACPLRRA